MCAGGQAGASEHWGLDKDLCFSFFLKFLLLFQGHLSDHVILNRKNSTFCEKLCLAGELVDSRFWLLIQSRIAILIQIHVSSHTILEKCFNFCQANVLKRTRAKAKYKTQGYTILIPDLTPTLPEKGLDNTTPTYHQKLIPIFVSDL